MLFWKRRSDWDRCDSVLRSGHYLVREDYMKRQRIRRIGIVFAGILALILLRTGLAAAEGDVVESGSCGTGVTYTITGSKTDGFTLTISGSGKVTSNPWGNDSALNGPNNYRTTIREIVIEEGITEIKKQNCFRNLTGLEEVTFPSSLTSSLPSGAFQNCQTLASIDLNKITQIEMFAFKDCLSLSTVTCGNVKSIKDWAFRGCNIISFTIPATLQSFNTTVFADNNNMAEYQCETGQNTFRVKNGIVYSKDGTTLVAVPQAYAGTLSVGSTVTTIAEYACYGNRGITKVTVPAGVTEIGDNAFAGMKALQTAVLKCACEIPEDCFSACPNLSQVTLSEGIMGILDRAFSGCPALTFPAIPDSVLFIRKDAFATDISALLPERFADCGDEWSVVSVLPVKVKRDYDSANALLSQINTDSGLRGSMDALTTSAELSEIAMQRAAEIAVYFDTANPIRPDGTRTTEHWYGIADEWVMRDISSATEAGRFLRSNSEAKVKIKDDSYSGVGIGCVMTGNTVYWAIVLQRDAGLLSEYGNGVSALSQDIAYAEYRIPDASVTVVNPFGATGSRIDPTILFEGFATAGDAPVCTLDPEAMEYTIVDTTVVALDEYGMPWGVSPGMTEAGVRFAGKQYDFSISVTDVCTKVSSVAVATHDCSVGDAFGIGYLIPVSLCDGYQEGVLIVSCPEYSGNTLTGTRKSVVREYTVLRGPNGEMFRKYSYYGLAAKEMTSSVEAVFCGKKNSRAYYYKADSFSIAEYALTMFDNTPEATLKTLLADMLYYGEEAQTYFNYHTDAPATAGMSAAMKACATQNAATLSEDSYSEKTVKGANIFVSGFSLSLESRPSLYFYLRTSDPIRFVHAEITKSTDPGTVISIPSEEWTDCGAGLYRVQVSGISVIDYQSTFTIACKKDGKTVSSGMTTGIGGYALKASEQGREAAYRLTDRLLRFGASSEAYRLVQPE